MLFHDHSAVETRTSVLMKFSARKAIERNLFSKLVSDLSGLFGFDGYRFTMKVMVPSAGNGS